MRLRSMYLHPLGHFPDPDGHIFRVLLDYIESRFLILPVPLRRPSVARLSISVGSDGEEESCHVGAVDARPLDLFGSTHFVLASAFIIYLFTAGHPNSRFQPLTDHSLALPSLSCCIFLHLYCLFPPYPNIANNVSRRIFYRNCRRRRRSRSFSTSGCKCICPKRPTGIFLLPPYHRRTAL